MYSRGVALDGDALLGAALVVTLLVVVVVIEALFGA
jgi:hypothetical protein